MSNMNSTRNFDRTISSNCFKIIVAVDITTSLMLEEDVSTSMILGDCLAIEADKPGSCCSTGSSSFFLGTLLVVGMLGEACKSLPDAATLNKDKGHG